MIGAAVDLLKSGGRAACSTRAVSAAADVQAPAIYRQFGDLDGLLQAAAHDVFRRYVRTKVLRQPLADPLDDLRCGWDTHVAFGLDNPAAFTLLYARTGTDEHDNDDNDDNDSAFDDGESVLYGLMHRLAEAGVLRVDIDHAVALFHAAGSGATLALIGTPPSARNLRVSVDLREATIAAITLPGSLSLPSSLPSLLSGATSCAQRLASQAMALRAVLDDATTVLSTNEQSLLAEWLDRLAGA